MPSPQYDGASECGCINRANQIVAEKVALCNVRSDAMGVWMDERIAFSCAILGSFDAATDAVRALAMDRRLPRTFEAKVSKAATFALGLAILCACL